MAQVKNKPEPRAKTEFRFDYAPAPEATDMVKIKKQNKWDINGKGATGKIGQRFDTINPANGEKLAELTAAGAEDVDRAVKAARQAFTGEWSKLSGKERGRYLFRIARIVQERSRELAVLETMDNGKPIKESRDFDIPQVAANFFYFGKLGLF